jgi:hypothetical protein
MTFAGNTFPSREGGRGVFSKTSKPLMLPLSQQAQKYPQLQMLVTTTLQQPIYFNTYIYISCCQGTTGSSGAMACFAQDTTFHWLKNL